MEPARDERGDLVASTLGKYLAHAAMEPARDERGDPKVNAMSAPMEPPQWSPLAMSGATRLETGHEQCLWQAAMEPARDERGDANERKDVPIPSQVPQWSPLAMSGATGRVPRIIL